jgi:hypothetical protein
MPITRMPKASHSRAASLPMPPTPGVERSRLPLPAQLPRQVVVEPAREGEHEGHDVGADVVVVDLAGVGDDHRMGDQVGIVEAGRRRGQGRLQPPQPLRLREQGRRERAEGGLGPADLAGGLGLVLRHHHRQLGERGGDMGGPLPRDPGLGREHQESGHGPTP